MKRVTHYLMCYDVLKKWENVLGFSIDPYMHLYQKAESCVELCYPSNGRMVPHHRTAYAGDTALIIQMCICYSRDWWLSFTEGRIEKSRENIEHFMVCLFSTLHLVQDFCMWSMPPQRHEIFEREADRIYRQLRGTLRKKRYKANRRKIYNTYWTLEEGEFTTASDPERYVREAYRRSSEVLSFILSERRLPADDAARLYKKYLFHGFDYWREYRGLAKIAVIPSYTVVPAGICGIIDRPLAVFVGILSLMLALLIYIVCKAKEFREKRRMCHVVADAADLLCREQYSRLVQPPPQRKRVVGDIRDVV